MNTCSIDRFSKVVRDNGGKDVALGNDQGTLELAPLRVVVGASERAVDPEDVGYLSREAADTVRVFPKALFTCPAVDLYGSGVAAVEAHVCRSTLRTRKFLRRATEQFEHAQRGLKSVAYRSDDDEPALLLAPMEHFNYSHWILEAVPKLGLFKRTYGKMPDVAVMVGSASPFHAESIKFVSASTALKRVKSTPVSVKNLCFTTSLARSVAELDPEIFQFYDEALDRHFSGCAPNRGRVYISRAKAGHRRVENEGELVQELTKLGFTVVDPGAQPFQAQVATFWNAEVVVGAHGAGLTNLAFAPNCRLAFELLSSGFRDGSTYAHICRHRRISYGVMSGEPVLKGNTAPKDPEGWPGHRSFRVDVQRLVHDLKSLL